MWTKVIPLANTTITTLIIWPVRPGPGGGGGQGQRAGMRPTSATPSLPVCLPPCHLCPVNTPHSLPSPLTTSPYLCHPSTTRRCRAAAAAWAVRATRGQPPSHLGTTQQKLYSPKCPFAQLLPRPNTGRGQEARHTTSPQALARPSEPLKAKTEGCVKAHHNTVTAGPRQGKKRAGKHYAKCVVKGSRSVLPYTWRCGPLPLQRLVIRLSFV